MKARIALIVVPDKNLNETVLRYLLLHLNTLQSSFQFEFYPNNEESTFLSKFAGEAAVDWGDLARKTESFATEYQNYINQEIVGFGTQEHCPDHYVIISMARFTDNYFSHRNEGVQVLALGNWERDMAPPSIHEFLLTLVLRQALGAVSPSLAGSVHYGTKGCICDMGADLGQVRFRYSTASSATIAVRSLKATVCPIWQTNSRQFSVSSG